MVWDPTIGQRAWPGGPPLGALAAMGLIKTPPTLTAEQFPAPGAETKRLAHERQEAELREHASRVASREAQTEWSTVSAHVNNLSRQIHSLRAFESVSKARSGGAVAVGLINLAFLILVFASGTVGDAQLSALGVFLLVLMIAPDIWALRVARDLRRRDQRLAAIRERHELVIRRGCGELTCGRCRKN